METIHYISDFTYFSGKKVSGKYGNVLNALKEHIKYIGRKAENVFTFNLDLKDWIGKAKSEIRKRWDSRVALKFVMALPLETNSENVNDVAQILQEFIAERLNVKKENISIAIHLHKGISGNYNPHAHILVYPRDKDGKKLRLNKKDLSEFHRQWQKKLREMGYEIKKDPEPLPHLGPKLYYDKDAQELYDEKKALEWFKRELLTVQREIANLDNHRSEKEEREGKERSKRVDVKEVKDFTEKQKEALLKHFNRLGYSLDDRLAIILVNHRENKVIQRFYTVREILSDKILRFLRAKNFEGYSVYASINVLKENASNRKKDSFKDKQKRIYLDLDSKNCSPKELIAKFFQYINLKGLPQPTHIVKSSTGNYQVYWVLDGDVEWEILEAVMEEMNKDLGLDHTQDVSRVFRLPYFRNKKPGKNDLVLNIDELKVFLKGKEVGTIKATGKPVKFESFNDILMGYRELPAPKPLAVYEEIDISDDVKRLAEKLRKGSTEKKPVKEFSELPKGYTGKVADYWKIVQSLLERLNDYISIQNERLEELRKLIELAFERNKGKSPSEIDLAIIGLIYSRYEGAPPDELLKGALFIVYNGAVERGKVNPDDYLKRTLDFVKGYWESRLAERENDDGWDLQF